MMMMTTNMPMILSMNMKMVTSMKMKTSDDDVDVDDDGDDDDNDSQTRSACTRYVPKQTLKVPATYVYMYILTSDVETPTCKGVRPWGRLVSGSGRAR